MKKFLLKQISLLALVLMMVSCSSAQRVSIGVKVRPNVPVYARPAAPSRGHVWIDGDWVWRNGNYVYQQGYWVTPRRGEQYIQGHWKNTRYGWQWTPGHWQRGRRW